MKEYMMAHPVLTFGIVALTICLVDNMWNNFCNMMGKS